jgi:plastocyanin
MMTLAVVAVALVAPVSLTGKVTLSNGKPARGAVIWLSGKEKGKPLKKAVIDQRDRKFVPHVLAVTVGTRVDFPNNDVVFHNVFSEYQSQKFDFGMYARGKSKSQAFEREGLAVLLCSIHPEMSAYVMVVDTPYFAVTDGSGTYKIDNIPPDSYRVQVWHEMGETYKAQRDVAGGTLDLELKK